MLDAKKNELRAKASVHPADVTVRYALGSGAVGEAAAARRIVNVGISVPSPARPTRGRGHSKGQRVMAHTSVVAVPIKSCRGRVLGVVEVRGQGSHSSGVPSSFNHEDELLLTWVAAQLAFVLERREMEREWRELQKQVRVGSVGDAVAAHWLGHPAVRVSADRVGLPHVHRQANTTGRSAGELQSQVIALTAAARELRQTVLDCEASLEAANADRTATAQALTEAQAQVSVLQHSLQRLQGADKQLKRERQRRWVAPLGCGVVTWSCGGS